MIKTAFAATLAVLFTFSTPANAQFTYTPKSSEEVGLYLGTEIWQSTAAGVLGEENTLIDFNLKKEQQLNFFIDVKHPLSFLPHARISKTTVDTSGQTAFTQKLSFIDKTFPTGNDIEAGFNVNYVDYTLYYELFDNEIFSFELGLSGRDLNGDVAFTGIIKGTNSCNDPNPAPGSPCTDESESRIPVGTVKTDDTTPMLYLASNISLPFTNLTAFAQANVLSIKDHTLSDYQIGFNYELMKIMMMDFNMILGYRVVNIELKNLNSLSTDLQFKGAFFGMVAHF
jgi:outer membrane protein